MIIFIIIILTLTLLAVIKTVAKRETKDKIYPIGFQTITIIGLLPIFITPMFSFVSILIFDNPQNMALTWLLFFLLNSYGLISCGLYQLSYFLYDKYQSYYAALPQLIVFIPIVLVPLLKS